MSSILVIGARSALARAAITRLQAEHTITTAGRHDCDMMIDVTRPVTIPNGIDVVLNFAAAFGGESDEMTIDAVESNVAGALRLCAAARQAGVEHFVQISSMSATHGSDSPYYSAYAITKRQADELLDWYCAQHDMVLTVLRPSQLYSNDTAFARHQPFFYQIIDAAEQGKDITIYGTHDARRNYLHAQDFSEIISRTIGKHIAGVYPCLHQQDVTYSQIAQAAQKVFGKGGKVVFLEDKPNTPDNVFDMDSSLYELIDFYPQITLEAGMRSIKQYREEVGQ